MSILPGSSEPLVEPVPPEFRAPHWWPAWLGLGLLWLLSWLPMPAVHVIGAAVGELFQLLIPERRRIARINLRLSFPTLDEAQRRRLAHAHFRALGVGLLEVPVAWFASARRLLRCTEFVGTEHLQAAQADGSGVLLLTGHFTTMELGCRLVALAGFPFYGMYRHADSPFTDYWMRRLRERQVGLPLVPKQQLTQVVRLLRRGGRIWYAPDQALDTANSAFVDFFGVPARTLTATSRLAQLGRCRVVPYFPQRVGNWWGGHYRVVFLPALEGFPSGDEVADARRVNALLEEAIRAVPEQYFWVHRRFKDGPAERPDPYARNDTK